MNRPAEMRYNEAMRQAERTEMALNFGGAFLITPEPRPAREAEELRERPAPTPFDFDRIDRYLEAFSQRRKISDARVWDEYVESLERRGLCLCPSCRVKVEKFGQYCETCKF